VSAPTLRNPTSHPSVLVPRRRRAALRYSPTSLSPGVEGASGVNTDRSGLRSMSGVRSRQSSPRTRSVYCSIPASLTIEVPIGLGRAGDRNEKVPRFFPSLRGLCRTRSRREAAGPAI
jgi:hypothetical protein